MTSPLPVAAAFITFAALHSLTVSRTFKRLVAGIVGERRMRAYYRFCFTLLSVVTAAAAGYVIFTQPDTFLYLPPGWMSWPARAVQLAGLILFILAQRPIDKGCFFGLRQARDSIRTGGTGGDIEGIPEGALVTTGVYGVVRHPMYAAGIMIFLFEPVITMNNLVLRALAAAYFVFGAFMEERRFIQDFGAEYMRYREKVPRLNVVKGIIRSRLS